MKIEYSEKNKKFVIHCSFHENSLIAPLPNKRFQKRAGTWHAPALSRNAAYMLAHLREYMEPSALEVAEAAMARMIIRPEPFPSWYRFKTTPFSHQKKALDHAWGLEAYALFMEMGTGKSKIAVDLHSARFMQGQIEVWVIMCPNALRDNWIDQWQTHSHLSDIPCFVVGDLTPKRSADLIKQAERSKRFIAIVGMESLQQKFRGGSAWDCLIGMIGDRGLKYAVTVDESHMVKNPDANRARNVEEIASHAAYRGIMTGSPIAQGILDLYQQFQILDTNIIGIGDFYSFRNRYAMMGGYENREVIGYQNVEELMGLMKPYVYQCTKAEALDLPEKMYSRRVVQMHKDQAKAYKELEKEMESMIRDLARQDLPIEIIVDSVLTKYNALQQITGGFVNYYDESGEERIRRSAWLVEPGSNPKVKEVLAIAEENPKAKIIIWAKFRNEIAIIADALAAKYGPQAVAEYHGGFTREERAENLRRFKEDEDCRYFIANQQTGGTGLTINESNLVIYFSNSLKLVERLQSEDRNHRIGQKNDVLYIDLVCAGTKDVDVLNAIRDKKDVAEYVRTSMAKPETA